MQFESYTRQTPTINISALIDVVFILLIFVVLAANFDRVREMNVVLPSANQTSEVSSEALTLTIPLDGPMTLLGEEISPAELGAKLKELRTEYESLLLVSDGRVDLDRAVKVFDEASAAGFSTVSIATRKGAP
ncbi:MAG: ExbD/TolR family protein [Bradymonadaceae bacterium]